MVAPSSSSNSSEKSSPSGSSSPSSNNSSSSSSDCSDVYVQEMQAAYYNCSCSLPASRGHVIIQQPPHDYQQISLPLVIPHDHPHSAQYVERSATGLHVDHRHDHHHHGRVSRRPPKPGKINGRLRLLTKKEKLRPRQYRHHHTDHTYILPPPPSSEVLGHHHHHHDRRPPPPPHHHHREQLMLCNSIRPDPVDQMRRTKSYKKLLKGMRKLHHHHRHHAKDNLKGKKGGSPKDSRHHPPPPHPHHDRHQPHHHLHRDHGGPSSPGQALQVPQWSCTACHEFQGVPPPPHAPSPRPPAGPQLVNGKAVQVPLLNSRTAAIEPRILYQYNC